MYRMSTRWFLGIAMGGAIGSAIVINASCAYAQSNIVPDNTLGTENSTVIPNFNGQPIEIISGGTQRGQNLFHSFRAFNVSNGRGAYFFSPGADIQNILARVTGGNRSEILGTLGTFGNSNPNLFLINPNGIIFGPNARLNVGGSFVATTANAIGFGNQGFFSATVPNTLGLLTVNPTAFFFNQMAAAPIQNNSLTYGIRVPDGRSLLLVGGDININGGGLYAFGGRVELGGASGTGTVRLNGDGNNLSLSFPDSVERSDVSLSYGAGIAVIAGDGGSMAINARNLEMTGESFLVAGIESGLGSDNSKAGNIEVNATGAINLKDGSFITNRVLPEARGQGGDVSISASTLRVEGGAQVGAVTSGAGKGGSLTVDAQDVQLIGTSANGQASSQLSASAQLNSTGNAGDLTMKTNTLLVRDGAQVNAATSGSGKGGSLTVDAQDVQLIGTSANGRVASGLFASAVNSTGDAGDLTIKTNTLLVRDGAQIGTFTLGSGKGGNLTVDAQDVQLIGKSAASEAVSGLIAGTQKTGKAGDLIITTQQLLISDGAQVSTGTFGSGKGGNLTVNAQDVQLIGRGSGLFAAANSTGNAGNLTIKTNTLLVRDGAQIGTFTLSSGKGGNLIVDAQDVQLIGISADDQFASGLIAGTQGTGKAGDLTITTQQLLISNGAEVTVSSRREGAAGNLGITASSVRLDNGEITAQTFSGNGGNLTLKVADLLLMRRGSEISTTAGTALSGGDGGNITINAPNGFIVAVPGENNDITANAFSGSGGRIAINATSIFGIAPLSRQDLERLSPDLDPSQVPTSDITAISQTNASLSGTVELNTPDIDPNSGLVELPTAPIDTEVAQGCYTPGYAQSSFVITGRGGLPPNPKDVLTPDTAQIDWVSVKPTNNNRSLPPVTIKPTTSIPKRIVEATGWVINAKGEVELTANAPTTPNGSWHNPVSCKTS